jgi:hypothetical protein
MARAVMKYAFAALLALLSTQAVALSVRVATAIEVVYSNEAEQQAPREARRVLVNAPIRQATPAYVSRTRPEPYTPALFQRPPPLSSLCS